MTDCKLALGTITNGDVRVVFMQSVMAARDALDFPWIAKVNGPYLDDARNFVVEKFVGSTDCTHLLFVDDDIQFTVDNITDLLKRVDDPDVQPIDIIAGWYNGGNNEGPGVVPIVYRWGKDPRTDDIVFRPIDGGELVGEDLIPVDAVGTGFMLIPRLLITGMLATYDYPTSPFAEVVVDGVHFGEDLTFCMRAGALGAKVHVDPRVRVFHHKVCAI